MSKFEEMANASLRDGRAFIQNKPEVSNPSYKVERFVNGISEFITCDALWNRADGKLRGSGAADKLLTEDRTSGILKENPDAITGAEACYLVVPLSPSGFADFGRHCGVWYRNDYSNDDDFDAGDRLVSSASQPLKS